MRIIKGLGAALLWLVIVAAPLAAVAPRFLDRNYFTGEAAHFDGAHFANPDEGQGEWAGDPTNAATSRTGFAGPAGFLVRWLTSNYDRAVWPEKIPAFQAKPRALPPLKPGEMRATWVGHATVLVETPGFTMLTDPIWSDTAGPFGLGPQRFAQPGIALDDLPKIDLIVVSHNHYDHMDVTTLKTLWDRDKPLIVTAPGNDAILASNGIRAERLDWGEARQSQALCEEGSATPCADWKVTVTRNHHWSSRWGVDRNRAFWSSFVVDTPSGSVFFAGDTGPGDMRWPAEAKATAAGPVRFAIIPIGAFRFERGQMWSGHHIGPKQAVAVMQGLDAAHALPMHWGTFQLSWEAYDTPPKMLALEMDCAGEARGRFAPRAIGQSFMVPAAAPAKPARRAACDQAAINALP